MNPKIRFDQVSKKYNLGLTRTSIPSLISNNFKRLMRQVPEEKENVLWALHDVSFELMEGESLALVGPNGAGKTTILKLLANITRPTSGKIESHGQLSALIELGAGFHPDLTGRENIYLNGTILGLTRNEVSQRFDEIVDFSELERFIDTPVKRYSSGMAVRLGFAVASCIQPDILLVDEVLAVGDAAFRQKCMDRIHALLEGGTSIIFVSHNLYLVQAVCHKGLYLEKGKVQFLGDVREAIDLYEKKLHQDRARKMALASLDVVDSGAGVEITKVNLLNSKDQEADILYSHEPAQIKIHYTAYRSLGKVNVSVFIIRSDGLTCCMMRTKIDGFDLDVDRGTGVITVNLEPLQLVGGTYYAEAFFLNESDSMAMNDSKPGRSDWFTVQGAFRSYDESSGIYEPNTRWTHNLNNAPIDTVSVSSEEKLSIA